MEMRILDNNLSRDEVCAVCGDEGEPEVGPQFFITDTEWVCDSCGAQQVPEMMDELEERLRGFQQEYEDVNRFQRMMDE